MDNEYLMKIIFNGIVRIQGFRGCATFPSGIAAEQMRQTYGLWVQRTTAELYKKRNQRTFGLVRASNAGATSFPM